MPLSSDCKEEKVTNVSYISFSPSNSDTITLLRLSNSEECPDQVVLIATRVSIASDTSMMQVRTRTIVLGNQVFDSDK